MNDILAEPDENKNDVNNNNELELEEAQVATSESMLEMANEEIHKLNNEVRELTAQVHAKSEECAYYKRLIKNLTTFQI